MLLQQQLAKHGWGRRLAIAVFVMVVPYAVINYDRLLEESPWSGSVHRWIGWNVKELEFKQSFEAEELQELQRVLKATALKDNTVIITTLNSAWAEEDSMFDLFLWSFKMGNGTLGLLKHMLVVSLDETAHTRCKQVHFNCFMLKTQGVDFKKEKYFMSSDYLKMMWRRIDFLRNVLELGYNFVFSDADILWLQNPFQHFSATSDFEIACDHFNGNPVDANNRPNGGFVKVNANARTIRFYKFWYESRLSYPGLHDQNVLDKIKFGDEFKSMDARFLSTETFANFCEIFVSRPGTACTMHANCCKGLDKKLKDLRGIMKDWSSFKWLSVEKKQKQEWSPLRCPKRKRSAFGFLLSLAKH